MNKRLISMKRLLILLILSGLSALQANAASTSERYQIVPSQRVLFQTPSDTNLGELVQQLYPNHAFLWSSIEAAIQQYNPSAFDAQERLIPGKRLQLVKLLPIAGGERKNLQLHDVIGTTVSAWGQVSVKSRNGISTLLQAGDEVFEGDQINTAEHASISLKMNDGAILSLRENSSVNLLRYHYPGNNKSAPTSVLELLRGGLRKVTGLIARQKPDRYQLRTATYTVGIRGTEFVAQLCRQQDCTQELYANDPAATLHTAVLEGEIVINQKSRQLGSVKAGETAYASAQQLIPLAQPAAGLLDAQSLKRWQEARSASGWQRYVPWAIGILVLGVAL